MANQKIFFRSKVQKKSVLTDNSLPRPTWSRMEVILKVTERCNINCTYCYFFNLRNDDYKEHPPYIGSATITECGQFLAQAAASGHVYELQIDFHGGEPLMIKKERFDAMCTELYDALKDVPVVRLVLQTNAMLIDSEWIELFAKHRVGIGISLDGRKQEHDRYRVDHRGNGTYDKTIDGLRLMQSAISNGKLKGTGVGAICVIDPDQDAKIVFRHFVDDLGLKYLHFLLPMYDHDTLPADINKKMSKYLCDLFDVWVERKDQGISIRYLQHLFGLLLSSKSYVDSYTTDLNKSIAYTIASNGDIGPGDDLRNSFPELFHTGSNVANTTLHDFVRHKDIANHAEKKMQRHEDCDNCCWGRVCNGGDLIGTEAFRYANANGFANKSVYCETIKVLLTHMTKFAVSKGVPFNHIAQALNIKEHEAV